VLSGYSAITSPVAGLVQTVTSEDVAGLEVCIAMTCLPVVM
jgi:hypothetical protein